MWANTEESLHYSEFSLQLPILSHLCIYSAGCDNAKENCDVEIKNI